MSHIMIADDHPGIRQLFKTILEFEGHLVTACADGKDVLDHPELQSCDLFLLDINMPKLDGIAVCRTLRQSDIYQDVPIVILTAFLDGHTNSAAIQAGANTYLAKPVTPQQLRDTVRQLLGEPLTLP